MRPAVGDPDAYFEALLDVVSAQGTRFVGACWHLTDPATGLAPAPVGTPQEKDTNRGQNDDGRCSDKNPAPASGWRGNMHAARAALSASA